VCIGGDLVDKLALEAKSGDGELVCCREAGEEAVVIAAAASKTASGAIKGESRAEDKGGIPQSVFRSVERRRI
jgi:hypothetical protein